MATLTQDQHFVGVTVTFFDGHTPPRPATIDQSDGPPVVASSDETVITITNLVVAPDDKSLTFDVESVGVGTAHFTVTADANMATGQVSDIILTSEDVQVTPGTAGQAAGGTITLPSATDKP
jgi:hypothetical protein